MNVYQEKQYFFYQKLCSPDGNVTAPTNKAKTLSYITSW